MVKTRLFPLESVFTLNIHEINRHHEAHYVLKKRFRIPEPIEVEFKSFFSDGRSYENFLFFILNLKNKKFKIKSDLYMNYPACGKKNRGIEHTREEYKQKRKIKEMGKQEKIRKIRKWGK
jgi:hypothetical protein